MVKESNKILAHNALYNIIYRILNVIFPLISASYIARVLEPEGVGKVAYAQNVVSYFVMFAALGIPRYGTREIARSRDEPEKINQIFSELFVLNAVSTCACAACFYVPVMMGSSVNALVYLVCGMEIIFNFINIDWFYEGQEEYAYITSRNILVKLVSLAALFAFVRSREDYIIYACIHCLGIGMNYTFNIVHARKKVKFSFRNLKIKRHLGPVFTLLVSMITASLYSKVDITMLGWMQSEETVAFYTNAHKMVNVALTLVTAMSAVFMPRLSYMYVYEKEKFRELITVGVKILLMLAVPCCAGIILIADDLIFVMFGRLFEPAVLTTQIMAILTVVIGVGDLLCYQVVISSGHEKVLIKARFFAGIANIILNSLLIPRFRHNGAAIASVISEVIVNGMLTKYSLSVVRPQLTARFFGSLLASVSAMTVGVVAIQSVTDNALLSLAASVGAGVAIYFAAALVFKNEIMEQLVSVLKSRMSRCRS